MFGTTEIIVISGVVLVLFGSAAIPRLARSIGKARREFEKGLKEGEKDAEESDATGGDDEKGTDTP